MADVNPHAYRILANEAAVVLAHFRGWCVSVVGVVGAGAVNRLCELEIQLGFNQSWVYV